MPVPLTALFAAAMHQVKAAAADPIGSERVLGLLTRAAEASRVVFEVDQDRLLADASNQSAGRYQGTGVNIDPDVPVLRPALLVSGNDTQAAWSDHNYSEVSAIRASQRDGGPPLPPEPSSR